MTTVGIESRPTSGNIHSSLQLQGIRHLNNHETVYCVLHVDKDSKTSSSKDSKTSTSKQSCIHKEQNTNNNSASKQRKTKPNKSVHFSEIEISTRHENELDANSLSSSANSSSCSLCSVEDTTNNNNNKQTSTHSSNKMNNKENKNAKSLSHHRHRKSSLPVKPSPLVKDSAYDVHHHGDDDGSEVGAAYHRTQRRSMDSLGLSPAPRRRSTLIVSPDNDTSSITSSQRSKKHSLTNSSTDTTKTPLHSGFIGSEEELEQLRFIKHALSTNAVPISPEAFRKRSNTDGGDRGKRINSPVDEFRARVASMDSGKKKNKSKH